MARIPEEEIERLKREVSIVQLVEARGVKLSGHGDNLLGLCPMHDDRSPSLVVSPAKNVFHCMGACQTGGSVIDWLMKVDHVSFRAAVEMLRKKSPSLVAERPGTRAKLDELAEPHDPDRVVLRRVVDFYHETMKQSPEAHAYLEKRGLYSSALIDRFRLGYANRTLAYRLPQKQIKDGEVIRTQLQRLGVLRGSGHEHFAGSIVIPIFSEDGEVLELYGRKIRNDLRKGTPNHLYLPRREDGRRGVFNLDGLKTSKEVILCEALIDALTFLNAGMHNVTSAYGVEGFTKEHFDALLEHGIERVLITYDRDEAGDRAAEKLAGELAKEGIEVFRVLFPKGMDANEYAQKVSPASKSLETAIRGAQWMAGTRRVPVIDAIVEESRTSPAIAETASSEANDTPAISAEPEAAPTLDAHDVAPNAPNSLAADRPSAEAEISEDEARMRFGDRRWRIRGLGKSTSYGTLRLNVFVSRGDNFFVDTIELYNARHRAAYLKQAAAELGTEEQVLKSDLGKIVLRLEEIVEQRIAEAQTPKAAAMTEEDRSEALALLKDPALLERILDDFDRAGVVGEEDNKLLGYVAAMSRKLEAPLAVVIQSSSAAGKSSLMDAVLRFVPEEERVQYSAMTGQSLFYMGETDLSHKILAIAEEQGVQSAAYALKLLQSEGELTIASTGKDPLSGKLVTHEYRVKGPVMIFLTTTAIEVDEELLNRCLVLTVDEGTKQTTAIHERQRRSQTLEGLLERHDRDRVIGLHQNAQRLLEPLLVANPFAKELRFSTSTTRTRRDHMKYLTLIRSIALLHQHQREVKTVTHRGQALRYIEVSASDIAIADRLSVAVMKNCLDELPPQTRHLLERIDELVGRRAKSEGISKSEVRFTRREIREHTKLGHTQLRVHVGRLEELEYLLVHGGGGKRRMVYELAPSSSYDPNLAGVESRLAGPLRADGGATLRQDLSGDFPRKNDLGGAFSKSLLPLSSAKPSQSKTNGHARGA